MVFPGTKLTPRGINNNIKQKNKVEERKRKKEMESEEAATVQATRPRRVSRTPVTAIGTTKRGQKPKKNDESQSPFSQQKSHNKATVDDKYSQWKTLLPILYDSFANHTLVWPSLSCRSVFLFLFRVFCSRVFNLWFWRSCFLFGK